MIRVCFSGFVIMDEKVQLFGKLGTAARVHRVLSFDIGAYLTLMTLQ